MDCHWHRHRARRSCLQLCHPRCLLGWLGHRLVRGFDCRGDEVTGKKARSVRVSDQVWAKAKAKAKEQGMTVSEVIVDFLKEFIK